MAINIFGDAPQSLTGLLGEQATNDLRKKALTTGLINAAIGYIAQPKNQGYGSVLPYVGRALMAGQQGAQGVYSGAIKDYDLQQRIEEAKRQKSAREAFDTASKNLYTTTPAQFETMTTPGGYSPAQSEIQAGQVAPNFGMTRLPDVSTQVQTAPARQQLNQEALQQLMLSGDPRATSYLSGLKTLRELTAPIESSAFGKVDPSKYTSESLAKFAQTGMYGDLEPIDKAEKLPVSAQEFEMAQQDPAYRKFLQDKWTAQAQFNAPYKTAEQERQDIENAYRFGRPPSPVPAPKSATMQDVADTAKATGKTTSQVIQDLKSRGIKVQGAK